MGYILSGKGGRRKAGRKKRQRQGVRGAHTEARLTLWISGGKREGQIEAQAQLEIQLYAGRNRANEGREREKERERHREAWPPPAKTGEFDFQGREARPAEGEPQVKEKGQSEVKLGQEAKGANLLESTGARSNAKNKNQINTQHGTASSQTCPAQVGALPGICEPFKDRQTHSDTDTD